MAKRNRNLDYYKMINEGLGSGKGKDYKPWLKIQDFPSKGRVTRVKGIKTLRQHELFSDLERNYFYYLDFSDNVMVFNLKYIKNNLYLFESADYFRSVLNFVQIDF
jgi:hypothetical protein